jgi:glycosyltransferase involved in cell wall biosynthesis
MTPLLAGGENGGARLVPLSIVPHLSMLAPDVRFTLLTNERNHDLLASLIRPNVGRHLVSGPAPGVSADGAGPLADLRPDLLVCPFTAPYYFDPVVPVVSVVYDLQYLSFPEFFSAEERANRARTFATACRLADRLICISDYVRSTVLANSTLSPDRVVTVHLGVLQELQRQAPRRIKDLLTRLGIVASRYLVFPANFWPHKNHRQLLTALAIFRSRHPDSDLQLVCTGMPDAYMDSVRSAAHAMDLSRSVVFPGYLTDDELAALYQACRALVFPSLYEGFGMPVLEAMAFDKPVLCSNVTSLPEIAGDAALLFDPHKPDEIADAIERIEGEPRLRATLVQRGRDRVARFGTGARLASSYLKIFRELMRHDRRRFTDAFYGLYDDGWVGRRMVVGYAPSKPPRTLELVLRAPDWIPWDQINCSLDDSGSGKAEQHAIRRGEQLLVRKHLQGSGGVVELQLSPVASPSSLGVSGDTRELGCECEVARLIGPAGSADLRQFTQDWLSLP